MPESHHSCQKYNSIIVVVCRLTGYIIAVPCNSDLSGAALAALFLERVVSFMGLRHEIFSGQDSILRANFFDTMMKLSGAEHHKSTVYSPKATGRAERAVQSIVQSLRRIMDQKVSKDGFHLLPLATWALNNLQGAVSGYSPHRLVFARDPKDKDKDKDKDLKNYLNTSGKRQSDTPPYRPRPGRTAGGNSARPPPPPARPPA